MSYINPSSRICVRCGCNGLERSVELHHWAPRAIFSDAEDWPKSFLCSECHDRWHGEIERGSKRQRRFAETSDRYVKVIGLLHVAIADLIVYTKALRRGERYGLGDPLDDAEKAVKRVSRLLGGRGE